MISNNLQGCKMLLLRRATDNQELLEHIEQLQGNTMEWRALDIVVNQTIDNQQTREMIEAADGCIFVSKNAAKHAASWSNSIQQKRVIAIGKATQQSLKEIGVNKVICPVTADTEGILELDELQQVNHQKIVIFKGKNGREKLQTVLAKRGAKLEALSLYQRQNVSMDAYQAEQIVQFSPNWVQITNEASAVSLDKANQRFKLFKNQKIKVLTVSQRLKEKLLEMGYVHIFTARSVYLKDNLEALQSAFWNR